MARVNVEQKAFTDPRFARLGRAIHSASSASCTITTIDAHRLGLGHMAAIWNDCQERETKTLAPHDIDIIIGVENASNFLLEAELGSPVKGGRIRIKGTKDRIDWLANARKEGRDNGGKGGRPPKPSGDTHGGSAEKTPPAPAPSPALNQSLFDEAWREYPRRIGKADAARHYRAQVKTRSEHEALLSAIRNYRQELQILGTEERFVMHGATFFNARWRDFIDGVWQSPSKGRPALASAPKPTVAKPPSEAERLFADMQSRGAK